MNKRKTYVAWSKRKIISDTMGVMTWMSLTTFMILAKNALGVEVIPIFEVVIFISLLIGIMLAHSKMATISGSLILLLLQETVFLIVLTVILVTTKNLTLAGYAVYMVMIVNALILKILNETTRTYEQRVFKTAAANGVLKIIRKRGDLMRTIGGAIGSAVAVIMISIIKTDIIVFTLIMLVLNIAQNIYDYYIWNKYIRHGKH